jgi:hypothetical protein
MADGQECYSPRGASNESYRLAFVLDQEGYVLDGSVEDRLSLEEYFILYNRKVLENIYGNRR